MAVQSAPQRHETSELEAADGREVDSRLLVHSLAAYASTRAGPGYVPPAATGAAREYSQRTVEPVQVISEVLEIAVGNPAQPARGIAHSVHRRWTIHAERAAVTSHQRYCGERSVIVHTHFGSGG